MDFDSYRSNLKFKCEQSRHDFEQNIRKLFITGNEKSNYEIATNMLNDLQEFEKILAVILRNKLSQIQKSTMKKQLC